MPAIGGVLFLVEHGQDEMLDRDVIVLQLLRLVLRVDEKLVEPLRDADLPARAGAADLRDAVERRLRLG